MEKMIVLLSAILLVSCKSNLTNSDMLIKAQMLIDERYSTETSLNSDTYSSYIAYEINDSMNYVERLESILVSEDIIRHTEISKDIGNDINIANISWYDFNLNPSKSPFYSEDVLNNMKVALLDDNIGQKLYPLDYAANKGPTAIVSYLELDINNDNVNDYISYITAGWIQGHNFNVTLQIDISGEKSIQVEDDIFLNYTDENLSFTSVHISNLMTNGLNDIVVEVFSRKTAEFSEKMYRFNGEKYSCM